MIKQQVNYLQEKLHMHKIEKSFSVIVFITLIPGVLTLPLVLHICHT